ncbi:MAG TPA: glycosyltransferase family 2 protein [Saprospiraceae bacterium]|nr:glycosyltransferase family 2 protein [Saprospiraceae bacterium]
MTLLSGVVIALNEERNIQACIQSLQSVASEVIVIDTGSHDRTIHLATEAGATVYSIPWKGYGYSKNYGNEKAANDWILSIDADEVIGSHLRDSISKLIPRDGIVYLITPIIWFENRWIKHSGWYPKYKIRIFNKKVCAWDDAKVHENVIVPSQWKKVRLKGDLLHYSNRSTFHYIRKINRYSRLKAQQWIVKGQSPGWAKRHLGGAFAWFKSYVLKIGFLDGNPGKKIAWLAKYQNEKELFYYDEAINH